MPDNSDDWKTPHWKEQIRLVKVFWVVLPATAFVARWWFVEPNDGVKLLMATFVGFGTLYCVSIGWELPKIYKVVKARDPKVYRVRKDWEWLTQILSVTLVLGFIILVASCQ